LSTHITEARLTFGGKKVNIWLRDFHPEAHMGAELETSWDVFEIFDLQTTVKLELLQLPPVERELAVAALEEFFEVVVSVIVNPRRAFMKFGQEISGLGLLRRFLVGGSRGIRVRWDSAMFDARRDEFGAIQISSIRMIQR
jgi:hypothetical protein